MSEPEEFRSYYGLPIINAPFRVYYAYNTMRLNDTIASPNPVTRGLFPIGGAGDATFLRTQSAFSPDYRMKPFYGLNFGGFSVG